jgi:hypothetical protein
MAGIVTVTVSGPVGSGKSAICGEIEILCRALRIPVEWEGGQEEKNLTHADWTAALEMYKPTVEIVESITPRNYRKPFIKRNVDGPLLIRSDSSLHYLTFRERVALRFGRFDPDAYAQMLDAQMTKGVAK